MQILPLRCQLYTHVVGEGYLTGVTHRASLVGQMQAHLHIICRTDAGTSTHHL